MRSFTEAHRQECSLTQEVYIAPGTQKTSYLSSAKDEFFRDGRFLYPNNFELKRIQLLACNYSEDETVALLNDSLCLLRVGDDEILSVPASQIAFRGYVFPHPLVIGYGDLVKCSIVWDASRLYKELFTRLELTGTLLVTEDSA